MQHCKTSKMALCCHDVSATVWSLQGKSAMKISGFSYLRSWEGLLNKCHVIICNYIPLVISMIYALPNDLRITSVSSEPPPMFSLCFIFNSLQIPLSSLPHHPHPTDPHDKSRVALVGLCTCTRKRKKKKEKGKEIPANVFKLAQLQLWRFSLVVG